MDTVSKAKRSWVMSLVRGKSTGPEIRIRRLISKLGYHCKLNQRHLPGNPDLVFPNFRKVIFVHGCFWHRHHCLNGKRLPKSRTGFWRHKLESNKRRDARNQKRLNRLGWRYLVVWECKLNNVELLSKRIVKFLGEF